MGLRELKKSKTRKNISNIATRLFIENGYHNVTVAEIAKLAEVSVPTLFNYFPTKESMVFDEVEEREEAITKVVSERPQGTKILDAIKEHLLMTPPLSPTHKKKFKDFMKLISETPELKAYRRKSWVTLEKALADVIAKETNKKIEAELVAHFIFDCFFKALNSPRPKEIIVTSIEIIRNGWDK